jgi:hypothetical protein
MLSPNSSPRGADAFVNVRLFNAYSPHITGPFVNAQTQGQIDAETYQLYPVFKEHGISDERIAIISGLATRDVVATKRALENFSPEDFL